MGEKTNYGIVTGGWLSGKTTVCKHLATQGHFVIDSKVIQEEIKKSYEDLPEPPEFVPTYAIVEKIIEKVNKQKAINPNTKFLFDSLPGTTYDEFSAVTDFMGVPDFVLNLLASLQAR